MRPQIWRALGRLACLGWFVGGASTAAAQPAMSTWPLFHGDAQRTGRSSHAGPAVGTNVRVAYKGFGAYRGSPVIGPDGTIYASSGRKLCAHDPVTDQVKWCNDINATVVFASPALGVDPMDSSKVIIYQGGRDNRMHAIDQNGNTLWTYAVGLDGDVATSAVMNAGGSVFFGGSTRIHSFTPAGVINWFQGLDGVVFTANPALSLDGNTVYVGTIAGSLYAFTAGGTQKWRVTVGRNIRFGAPAVADDGTIYIGSRDGLSSVTDNGSSATINWTFPMIGHVASTPAIGTDGTIYVGGLGSTPGGAAFYAIKSDGSGTNWTYRTGTFFRGSPVIDSAGRVYATSGRDVYAFDSGDPMSPFLWRVSTARNLYSSPALGADGQLWITGSDRKLYAIHD
jgi:outer membrane protein assembly factor BamB